MDLLDRLLGHDAWTTNQLLVLCQGLSADDLDRVFDVGHGTLRETFAHMIGNVEVWTGLLRGDVAPEASRAPGAVTAAGLLARHGAATAQFAALARQIAGEGRLDELWTDHLDDPPTRKTRGGAIGHVITHNMHHRAEVLHMLARLGVEQLPEGDLLTWETRAQHARP